MKNFIIKESQFNELIQRKKDSKIAEEIKGKIDRANKSLNESIIINEAVKTIIESYSRKGLINENVIGQLVESGKITQAQIERVKL